MWLRDAASLAAAVAVFTIFGRAAPPARQKLIFFHLDSTGQQSIPVIILVIVVSIAEGV